MKGESGMERKESPKKPGSLISTTSMYISIYMNMAVYIYIYIQFLVCLKPSSTSLCVCLLEKQETRKRETEKKMKMGCPSGRREMVNVGRSILPCRRL